MEWFYQIPGVGDLRSADAFFQFFAVYGASFAPVCCSNAPPRGFRRWTSIFFDICARHVPPRYSGRYPRSVMLHWQAGHGHLSPDQGVTDP